MAETWKKLYQNELTTSVATLYTVPGATQAIIKYIVAINFSNNGRTLELWHDGTVDANIIFGPTTIPAKGRAEFDGNLIMEAGDTLSGQAEANDAISLAVYGLEVS